MTVVAGVRRPELPELLLGDAGGLTSLASTLRSTATELASAQGAATRAVADAVWTGPAADVRDGLVRGLAQDLAQARQAVEDAHAAVEDAATQLGSAQSVVRTVRAQAVVMQAECDRLAALAVVPVAEASGRASEQLQDVARRAAALERGVLEVRHRLDVSLRRVASELHSAAAVLTRVTRTDAPAPQKAPELTPGRHWWEKAGDTIGDAVTGTAHAVVNATQDAWDFGESMVQYYADNPAVAVRTGADAAELVLGAYVLAAGASGEVGGVVLDATGAGAVAGVPINVAAAGVIVLGAGAAGVGLKGLGDDLGTALSERRPAGRANGGTQGQPVSAPKSLDAFPRAGSQSARRRFRAEGFCGSVGRTLMARSTNGTASMERWRSTPNAASTLANLIPSPASKPSQRIQRGRSSHDLGHSRRA